VSAATVSDIDRQADRVRVRLDGDVPLVAEITPAALDELVLRPAPPIGTTDSPSTCLPMPERWRNSGPRRAPPCSISGPEPVQHSPLRHAVGPTGRVLAIDVTWDMLMATRARNATTTAHS
jgi:hypothetical protein